MNEIEKIDGVLEMVRRIDDLGRVVIPKEIRRTMRITTLTPIDRFCWAIHSIVERVKAR